MSRRSLLPIDIEAELLEDLLENPRGPVSFGEGGVRLTSAASRAASTRKVSATSTSPDGPGTNADIGNR